MTQQSINNRATPFTSEIELQLAQKVSELERCKQQLTQLKTELSHEIRTSLTTIIGYAEVLYREKPAHAVSDKYLQHIIHDGESLITLLNRYLEYNDLHNDNPTNTQISGSNESIPLLSGNILLAEDTLSVQQFICHHLKATGAEVSVVQNGQHAIEQAISHDFDLLLLDIQMPVMNGKEALTGLRQLGYSKPVYALTADVSPQDLVEYQQIGFTGTLAKPLNLSVFFSVLARHLHPANIKPSRSQVEIMQSLAAKTNELKPRFIASLKLQYQELLSLIEQDNFAQIAKILHMIKGSAGNFGYQELTELAHKTTTIIKQQHFTEVNDVLDETMLQLKNIINTEVNSSGKDEHFTG